MGQIVGPSEYCRFCGHEVGIHYDMGSVNGVITPGPETWRSVTWASAGNRDIRLAGTADCERSPDGLHQPLPPLSDPTALQDWLNS